MKRFLLTALFVALFVPALGYASPQSDVVQHFERLHAMLDVGTSRMEIQRVLVDVKMLINKMPAESEFAKKADHLVEGIKIDFLLPDLMPTKRTAVELAKEDLEEHLPELKALLNKRSKRGRP